MLFVGPEPGRPIPPFSQISRLPSRKAWQFRGLDRVSAGSNDLGYQPRCRIRWLGQKKGDTASVGI